MNRALVDRIWDRDHTVWQDDPTEVADRLGWLDCPTSMRERVPEFTRLADEVAADGIDRVLLVGMGGSSLYPEVLAEVFGRSGQGLELSVLDSTHPDAVARARAGFAPGRTLLVASSKSGSTVETRSHLERFWTDLVEALGEAEAGRHVVAVTDPGSALADLGRERGFRDVVENPPDIGGRYSALSAFGLLPAALLGLDVTGHLEVAGRMAEACRAGAAADNPGLRLGTFVAEAAAAGRDQLTVLLPPPVRAFGAWIEQLVAESTGKHGLGVLPVVAEHPLPSEEYGKRRALVAYGDVDVDLDALRHRGVAVVQLPSVEADDLPGEVFRWEFATAVAGAHLGLNPFDQPDVQAAKVASSRLLEEGADPPAARPVRELLDQVGEDDHVALLAFVDPAGGTARQLPAVAEALRTRLGVPVTVGVGPRYLHSTGQFHKGGADHGVHLVVFEEATEDVEVPERGYTFGQLVRAQAAGDLEALAEAGRRAGRVDTTDLLAMLDR